MGFILDLQSMFAYYLKVNFLVAFGNIKPYYYPISLFAVVGDCLTYLVRSRSGARQFLVWAKLPLTTIRSLWGLFGIFRVCSLTTEGKFFLVAFNKLLMRLLRRDLHTAATGEVGAVAGIGALSRARPPARRGVEIWPRPSRERQGLATPNLIRR